MAEVRAKYPQYDDLSDEQLAQGLHQKFYSDMPFDEFAGKVGLSIAPVSEPTWEGKGGFVDRVKDVRDSLADTSKGPGQALRQVGLAGGYAAEGATALLNLPIVALNAALNAAGSDYHAMTVGDLIAALGGDQPKGATERIVADLSRALASVGGNVAVGEQLAGSAAPVVQRIGQTLQAVPDVQATAASGGALASGATREAGGGPIAQFIAGLAGSVAAPAAVDVAKRTVTAGVDMVRPFFKSGQERIAGNVLRDEATDPIAAQAALQASQPTVPGSQPMSGAASKDIGLLGMERTARNLDPTKVGARATDPTTQ
jgi:hypothetical protein